MNKAHDELVSAIRMPRRPGGPGALHLYRKVGTRKAQAIAKIGLAALARIEDGTPTHVRLGFSSVAALPLRARSTERVVEGARLDENAIERVLAALDAELTPIDDVRSTARYRRRVALDLVRDFLARLTSPARGGARQAVCRGAPRGIAGYWSP